MTPYWNEFGKSRPGLPIKEVELRYNNVYIEDARGNVWQLWIEYDKHVSIQLIVRK